MNFKVIFELDGRGVFYDPFEPPHLDDLLHSILIMLNGMTRDLQRDEPPDEVGLPLMQTMVNGHKIWNASALFPEGKSFETLEYFRKKYPLDRLDLTTGSVNLQSGKDREYNQPLPLLCVPRLVAYASGNRKKVKRLLKKHIVAIGKHRAKGKGRIVNVECIETPENWSLVKDGKAQRYLPHEDGLRLCRIRPPYWNSVGRVSCCEIGQDYTCL
jgi:CRISPR type IV-associated protein Csf3